VIWEVWGPPLAVLGVGLIVGMVLTWRSRGRVRRDAVAEFRARKDSLVDQLRSLEADRGKLSDAVYADRWARLLDAAADALRAMDATIAAPPSEAPDAAASPTPVRWTRRIGWAAAVLLFFGGLGYWLTEFSSVRAPDGSLTGTAVSGQALQEQRAREAKEALEANPADLDALNLLSHIALEGGDYGEAMKWMDQARKLAPDDAEVHTHLAILQISVGMTSRAEEELDAAIATDPTLSEALVWRGMLQIRKGDREGAIPWLERALENATASGDRRTASRALLEARRPPPEEHIRGRISMADGAVPPTGGVVFVIVRRSAATGGPPAAAVRLDPRGLPGSFSVTDRDLMMGGEWPEQVWIEARWDADGNPTTRSEADLSAPMTGPHASGALDLSLVLSGGSATPTEAAASGQPVRLQGTVSAADGVAIPMGGAVFIIVRRSAERRGPPAAALRLAPSAVPGPFEVGDSDLMMGGSWPSEVWVQARADADGNAMTRSEADVSSAVVGPLTAGARNVVLTLGE
jgi:tetratricopeptide (TPR) repeat protein